MIKSVHVLIPRMENKKFIINKFLSLGLFWDKTFIFVNGKKFRQCKYVLLNIPVDDIDQYSSINSIDEVIDNLDHSLEEYPEMIPPETEFWAHCSNLQAWAENDYNTDLLVLTLSFPLLKELTNAGDSKAKRVFKEEIGKRLMRGDLSSIGYLIAGGYLEFLTCEELISIFSSDDCFVFDNIFKIYQNDPLDQFGLASSIYRDIGKYLFSSIERKLDHILNMGNVEDLYIFFNYYMFDFLTDEEISILFDSPMDLLEKSLSILNKVDCENIKLEEGLLSERIEKVLGDKIRERLLKIIYKKNMKYDVFFYLDLLKYLKNEDTDYLNYLQST